MAQIFYMTIGLPASGKSSFVSEMPMHGAMRICSSDEIRGELYGDESIQKDPSIVFNIMKNRANEALAAGKSVYYDATNIQYKHRASTLEWFRKRYPDVKYIALVFAVPIEECIMRDSKRERRVGADVINKMAMQFNVPSTREGFDEVRIIRLYNNADTFCSELIKKMCGFNQHNSHHTLDLLNHCTRTAAVYTIMSNMFACDDDYDIALFHDVGKLYTQTFLNCRGEITDEAHYYGHEHVSAYCYLCLPQGKIDGALIIENHMKPYLNISKKGIQRIINRIGDKNWEDVLLLHKADDAAH